MISLSSGPLEVRSEPSSAHHAHVRQTDEKLRLGIIIVTTFFLVSMAYYRGIVGTDPIVRTSVSAYCHHENHDWRMRDTFVACLSSVGVLLIVYQGYTRGENRALTVTGAALLGVVAFPMDWPPKEGGIHSWTEAVHYTCAITFFAGLMYVMLWHSRNTLHHIPDELRHRKQLFTSVYYCCGLTMLVLPLVSLGLFIFANVDYVYLAEYGGGMAFVAYWVTKTIELRLPHGNHLLSTTTA